MMRVRALPLLLVVALALHPVSAGAAYEGFIIPNSASASFAAQARVFAQDLQILADGARGNGIVHSAGACAVVQAASPDMTVRITTGCTIVVNTVTQAVTTGNFTIAAANATNPRIDIVGATSAGVKTTTTGTAAASPLPPTIPDNHVVFAFIYVPANDTAIGTTQITDKRIFVQTPGVGGGAGTTLSYITKVAEGTLSNEFALGSLATGLLVNTVTTGVPTVLVPTDDNVAVGNGTVWEMKALPTCSGATDALAYNISTNTFTCNTIATVTTAATTGNVSVLAVKAISTGAMGTDFGPMVNFIARDTDAVDNTLGQIAVARSGADNTGALALRTMIAGVQGDRVTVDNTGGVTLPTGPLMLGVAGTAVGSVGFKNATSGTITVSPVTGALGTVTLSLPAATDTLVGKQTTDVLTNKTLDAEGTGNVVKAPFKVWLPAAGCDNATAGTVYDQPTSNGGTAACYGTSPMRFGALNYIDGANALTSQVSLHLPSDWDSAQAVDVKFLWFSASTSTNSVVWTLQTACLADTEDLLAPSFNAAQTVTDANNATANTRNSASITSVTMTGCAAGEMLVLRLGRDPTNGSDTLAATAALIGIEVTFRRSL